MRGNIFLNHVPTVANKANHRSLIRLPILINNRLLTHVHSMPVTTRLIMCAETDMVNIRKIPTVIAFTPIGTKPTFTNMLCITPNAPSVSIFDVACKRLYTSGRRSSPNIPRDTNMRPITSPDPSMHPSSPKTGDGEIDGTVHQKTKTIFAFINDTFCKYI